MSKADEHRPGYKHTPLGWIPEEWKIRSLSDDIEFLDAGVSVNSINEKSDSGEPCVLKTSAVNGGYFYPEQKKKILMKDLHRAKLNPTANSIIISRMNTPELVGECGYVDSTYNDIFLPDRLWQTRFYAESETDVQWLNYLLNEARYKAKIKGSATGTSNSMKNISKEAFLNIAYISPTKPEQLKIATILSTWDEAITKTQQLIVQLERRNRGLMQAFLEPKDDWKTYQIGDLLKEVKRPIIWDDDELYHLVSVRRRSGGAFFRQSLHGKLILTKQLFVAEAGDFLISKMQIVHGASAVVPPELAGMKVSGSYIVAHSKNDDLMDINFFNWLSKTRWFYRLCYISSYGVHIEKMTFDFTDFKRRKISLPSSIEEQRSIIRILQTASDEVKLYDQKLAALQQQKKGLMQKLLTGEVRVNIDINQN